MCLPFPKPRLTTEYEVRGMPSRLSSCATSTPNGPGSGGGVINQVALAYNSFGQLITDAQEHIGSVEAFPPRVVYYNYLDGTDNTIDLLSFVYPSERIVTLTYDDLRRVTAIEDGIQSLATYGYLGMSRRVVASYPSYDAGGTVTLDLWGGTPGTYTGLDAFERVTDQRWALDGGGDLSRFQYGYDRNSNRLYKADLVAQGLSKKFDELYAYDELNRLTDMQRGLLNSGKTALQSGTLKFRQHWGLDPVGNWPTFQEDDTGDGTYDLVQNRTSNKVNEISLISASAGPTWVTPQYDAAGNTTTMPRTDDPTEEFNAVYDAWNRLVRITKPDSPDDKKVAEYEYDARGYRVRRRQYNASTGAFEKAYDDYFSNRWQLIETRVTTSSTAVATQLYEQFIWGQSTGGYVDELILRARDTNNDGTLDETLYALQDANYNVAAIFEGGSTNAVVERYCYAPYGMRTVLDSNYSVLSASAFDWEVGHQGLIYDYASHLIYNRHRFLHANLGFYTRRDDNGVVINFKNDTTMDRAASNNRAVAAGSRPTFRNTTYLQYADGQNIYLYEKNNPPTLTDSMGRVVALLPVAISVAGYAAACAAPFVLVMQARAGWTNDKYAHCVVACQIKKLCNEFAAEIAGAGKEFRDELEKLVGADPTGWDPTDIKANRDGEACAPSDWWHLLVGVGTLVRTGISLCSSCDKCCRQKGHRRNVWDDD